MRATENGNDDDGVEVTTATPAVDADTTDVTPAEEEETLPLFGSESQGTEATTQEVGDEGSTGTAVAEPTAQEDSGVGGLFDEGASFNPCRWIKLGTHFVFFFFLFFRPVYSMMCCVPTLCTFIILPSCYMAHANQF